MENMKSKEMEKAIVVRIEPDDPESGAYMYPEKSLDELLSHIQEFFRTSKLGDRLVLQSGEIERFRHPDGWDSEWDGTVEALADKKVQLNIVFENMDEKEKGFSFAFHGPNVYDTLNPLWTQDQIVAWRIGYAEGLQVKEENRYLISKDKYAQSILQAMQGRERYSMVTVDNLYDLAIVSKKYRRKFEDFLEDLLGLVNCRAVALLHAEEDEFGNCPLDKCFVTINDTCLG